MLPFTQKMLLDWAGPHVFRDAKVLFERGSVHTVAFEPPFIRGTVTVGSRDIASTARVLSDGTCENKCPCRDSQERGIICSHVIALGLELIRRSNDPELQRKRIEEARRAARLAKIQESDYLRRVPQGAPGAVAAKLQLILRKDWIAAFAATGKVPLACAVETRNGLQRIDQVPADLPCAFSKQDESILYVLEDIAEGPAQGRYDLPPVDFNNVLDLYVGKPLLVDGQAEPLTVNPARMVSRIRMDMDRENGEILLMVHTELPFMKVAEFPLYSVGPKAGWVFGAGNFWPLENLLPGPLRTIYDKPISVPRPAIPRFLQVEVPLLEKHMQVESELSLDLFSIEPAVPAFRLAVKGSPASLAATLYADYSGVTLVAGKPDVNGQFSHPDPADHLRFTVRNPVAEQEALGRLAATGFKGEAGDGLASIVGCREVLNFLARDLPDLRRLGWKVELDGMVDTFMDSLTFVTPVVHVQEGGGADWFEVNFEFDSGDLSISPPEIHRALMKGESFVEKDGRTVLLDSRAIHSMNEVFRDCASGEGRSAGSFRLPGIYAPYVKSSLDALDGIDVEAAPAWQGKARQQNRELRMEPVDLGPKLEGTLRGYQKEGVNWLRFMEANGFCGILADEMGLGKTLQTLSWLQLPRTETASRGQPALIVCPTSLVENWAEEAAKFTPHLRVMTMSGSDRHENWKELGAKDLVVTSYALLRRDIEQYDAFEFAAVVLDEAQHIKNRSTQNSLAAKRLKAVHRLVLTGTPIENSVSDLWSIMDFLMPGYMGSHETFKANYEQPISAGGQDAAGPQAKLRRKLHPFLLRRLKKDVAKDLPPRIEKLALCPLTPDQKMVYQQLLEASRRRLFDMVADQGFNRSRMEILKTLLRLRQVSCHLDLLKLDNVQSKNPSGKMDLFFELLDEACDGGHRVLVFSQFVSMLTILRQGLEQRGLRYCYLDGSTQERMKIVHEFNTDRSIPVFLISLKAGGSGLNLTGADMVIHFDPWWNPAVEDQATDRAHRIGQKRTVYSVKLITRGTVEEKVLEMQRKKKAVIDATLATDEQVMSKLTWDDVQELLTL